MPGKSLRFFNIKLVFLKNKNPEFLCYATNLVFLLHHGMPLHLSYSPAFTYMQVLYIYLVIF